MRCNRMTLAVFFVLVTIKPVFAGEGPFDAVIIGDSISTGGGSHPALRYDAEVLWQVFNDRVSTSADLQHLGEYHRAKFSESGLPPPVRLWPSMREFFGGPDWVYRNLLSFMSQKFLDTEEYSWGYLTAKDLGLDVSRIAIAAEDGARVQNIPRQVDRVLQKTGGRMPPKVFIFYTGNDLCGMDPSFMTSVSDFRKHLTRGLTYLARNSGVRLDQGDKPVEVYILSFMSLVQLLDSKDVLEKKITAFGKETTCAQLRKDNYRPADPLYQPKLPPEAWYFGVAMPPNPAAFCPTVFLPQKFKDHAISDLANRIRDYRQSEAEVVSEFQKIADKGQEPYNRLSVRYLQNTASLRFAADEVGEDCFHLSIKGQEKVAVTVGEEIRNQETGAAGRQ